MFLSLPFITRKNNKIESFVWKMQWSDRGRGGEVVGPDNSNSGREGEHTAPSPPTQRIWTLHLSPRAGGAKEGTFPGRAPHSRLDSSSQTLVLHGEGEQIWSEEQTLPSSLEAPSHSCPSHRARVLTPSCWCQQLPMARRRSLPLLAGAQL